jgi:HSF-type DNA-binding
MQTNHSAALAAFLAANPGANASLLSGGGGGNSNSNQSSSSHGGTQPTSPPFDPRSASLQAALSNTNSGSNHSAPLASLDPSSASFSLLQQVSHDADAINVAQLRTANLLNQYFARQQQIEQQEKMLLAHRLASTLGGTGGNTTSTLSSSLSGPQSFLPLPNSSAVSSSNNSGSAMHSENALLLELLRRKEQQDQQALQLKQLQELRSSSSLYPLGMMSSSDSSSAPLLSQLQRLQQDQQQPSNTLFSLQLLAQLGGGGGGAALYPSLLRNHAASQAASQMDSRALASSNDTLLAQLLQQQQQNNAASRLASTAESSNTAPSFERSVVDTKPPRPEGTSSSPPSKSRRTGSKLARRKGRVGKFPLKLHQLLLDLAREGRSDIAAFLPHGRAFAIFKPVEFAAEVMPHYFRMSRFSSFQRQLNLYDFQRVVEGTDKGSYFVR